MTANNHKTSELSHFKILTCLTLKALPVCDNLSSQRELVVRNNHENKTTKTELYLNNKNDLPFH